MEDFFDEGFGSACKGYYGCIEDLNGLVVGIAGALRTQYALVDKIESSEGNKNSVSNVCMVRYSH